MVWSLACPWVCACVLCDVAACRCLCLAAQCPLSVVRTEARCVLAVELLMSCEVKPSLCQSLAAGLTAENVAEKYHVEREAQDRFAAASHAKAATAQVGAEQQRERLFGRMHLPLNCGQRPTRRV